MVKGVASTCSLVPSRAVSAKLANEFRAAIGISPNNRAHSPDEHITRSGSFGGKLSSMPRIRDCGPGHRSPGNKVPAHSVLGHINRIGQSRAAKCS